MHAAPAVDLIADPYHHRQQQQVTANPREGIADPHDRVDQNADQHDDQQKAGSAAGMKTRFRPHIFHRQFLSVLIAENGLVFGAVIGEQTLDILHFCNQRHISEQDDDLENALRKVSNQITACQRLDHRHKKCRQDDEKKDRQQDTEHDRHIDDQLGGLFLRKVIRDPFVDFVGFSLLFQRYQTCGISESLHSLDQ